MKMLAYRILGRDYDTSLEQEISRAPVIEGCQLFQVNSSVLKAFKPFCKTQDLKLKHASFKLTLLTTVERVRSYGVPILCVNSTVSSGVSH